MKYTVWLLSIFLILVAAVFVRGRGASTVTLSFPDFPEGVAVVELGDTLTLDLAAENDGGKGVTWTCTGEACTTLTSTPNSATYKASGITGTIRITARSIQQPAISKSITVIVNLNDTPDLLC